MPIEKRQTPWCFAALACFLLLTPAVLSATEGNAQPPAAIGLGPEKPQNALIEAFSNKNNATEPAKAQTDIGSNTHTEPAAAGGGLGQGQPAAEQRMRVLLVANKEASIASRLYGTISKIHVKEGERFKAGQLLVSFDCRELAAERDVAMAKLRLYNGTNKANAGLYTEKMIGSLEKDLSQAKVTEAEAKMANCAISAPFDGQAVELQAKAHETLQPGSPIMLIQDSRDLEAHVHVPSTWMTWLKPGATFQTQIEETGAIYQAEMTSMGARVDPVSRTIKIYAKISGDHPELLPGMSGYTEFTRQ
ncbi:MAG: efflux RND transporter periplasmic adaptor subunit [Desulfobulbaceae bacterium]|nr:efflux RND transporter periplasmic adaptor subunit [Desulfobulbaceae bacterium]